MHYTCTPDRRGLWSGSATPSREAALTFVYEMRSWVLNAIRRMGSRITDALKTGGANGSSALCRTGNQQLPIYSGGTESARGRVWCPLGSNRGIHENKEAIPWILEVLHGSRGRVWCPFGSSRGIHKNKKPLHGSWRCSMDLRNCL